MESKKYHVVSFKYAFAGLMDALKQELNLYQALVRLRGRLH